MVWLHDGTSFQFSAVFALLGRVRHIYSLAFTLWLKTFGRIHNVDNYVLNRYRVQTNKGVVFVFTIPI